MFLLWVWGFSLYVFFDLRVIHIDAYNRHINKTTEFWFGTLTKSDNVVLLGVLSSWHISDTLVTG